jgi:hypothetical protein
MTETTETVVKEKRKPLTVDNSTNNLAKVEYIAVCDFTTIKKNEVGELENAQVNVKDVLTARDVPQVWLDQAESQRFIIKKKDLETMTADDLAMLGYPKNLAFSKKK